MLKCKRREDKMKTNKGFTLIELLVVIIIVGILAAVAAPIMRGYRKKAVMAEAIAALGTIRTLQRAYHVEHGEYAGGGTGSGVWFRPEEYEDFFFLTRETGDFNGTYFNEECYGIFPGEAGGVETPVLAVCQLNHLDGVFNYGAPQGEYAYLLIMGNSPPYREGHIIMDINGNVFTHDIPNSGYPEIELELPE